MARTPAELVDRLTDHFVRVVPPASVAWVHPSWRDLVITMLAEDEAERTRILERCGLEGMLLALSVAGGAAGERSLPLLRADADWDIAAARVVRLAPDLDDPSVIRLLGSLRAALETDLPGGAGDEAAALAGLALERIAAAWDDAQAPVSVAALEAWFRLAAVAPDPLPVLQLGPKWIELLPTQAVDVRSRAEVVRLDDWLALVEVLRAFAPDALDRFVFPRRQRHVLDAFVADSAKPSPDDAELVTRILWRIRRVTPAHAAAADHAAQAVASRDEPWFEVRFETHPRRPEPAPSDRDLVERVLRDLG